MDQVLSSTRVPSVTVHKFEEEAMRRIHELGIWLLNYKNQLIQERDALVLQEHLDTALGSVFEFAHEQDARYMPSEPRKRNGLDFWVKQHTQSDSQYANTLYVVQPWYLSEDRIKLNNICTLQ